MSALMYTGTVTVVKPTWIPDGLNAPTFDDETTLHSDVPCRRQDVWDMQVDDWGQKALKNVCLFFFDDPGEPAIPNGAFLVSEGQTLRVTGIDKRREFASIPTFLTVRAEIYQP